MRPTVLLFDVDGTLVSCGGAGMRAMKAALLELAGRDDVFDFPFGGATDRGIARRVLNATGIACDEQAIDAFLARYLDHLPSALSASTRFVVHAGVTELLARLDRRAGYAVGLGTGNVEAGARAKLERAGLGTRFAFGGFGDDHEERAHLIEAGARRGAARLGVTRDRCRVVVIGDTPRDVAAAHAIGAECIAVATGQDDMAVLAECGALAVVADLRSPAIDALLGLAG